MLAIAFSILFIGLMFMMMWLAYFRMIGVRDGTQSRLEVDPEPTPHYTPYTSYTEDEIGPDGLRYGKTMNFDPSLSSADKRASELPDINQTLQGKR